MAKHVKVVWLGDEDANAQLIRMGDLTFIKGEAVTVDADHGYMQMINGNPTFAVDDSKAEPRAAAEPSEEKLGERADEGTEKGALKGELAKLGIVVKGNPSADTLRARLAEATK